MSARALNMVESPTISLRANVVANYLGFSWRALMSFVFLPTYLEYLGAEAFGLISLYAVFQAWVMLADLGLRPALSREFARYRSGPLSDLAARDLLRSVEVIAILLAAVIAGLIAFASPWLAHSWLRIGGLQPEVVTVALQLIGVVACLQVVESVYTSVLGGLQRQALLNLLLSLAATVRSAGALVILSQISATPTAFFSWQLGVSITAVAAIAFAVYAHLPSASRAGQFNLARLIEIKSFSGGVFSITVLALGVSQVDKIVLSRLVSLDQVAYYMLATSLAGVLTTTAAPVGAALYPRFVSLMSAGNEAALCDSYHQGTQLLCVVTGSAASVVIIFGADFLYLWTGNLDVAEAVFPIMALLALGNLLNAIMTVPYNLQLAHGWTSLVVTVNAVAIVFLLPALLVVVGRFGAAGAASVWLILNVYYIVVIVPLMHRKILHNEMRRWFVHDVALPIAASFTAAVVVKSVLSGAPSWQALGISSAIVLLATVLSSSAGRKCFMRFLSRGR